MMIVRPGPYICAEWERGGFPSWVAAKRFPLRSNDPQSLSTSRHWYSAILPVIMKNQIMLGGPIIMVQVENEYDFSPPMPDDAKRAYIRALAQMMWSAGITVPVITCWTRQARENADPDMARIIDTCNFYPRWKIVEKLTPPQETARRRALFPARHHGTSRWMVQHHRGRSGRRSGRHGRQGNRCPHQDRIRVGSHLVQLLPGLRGHEFRLGREKIDDHVRLRRAHSRTRRPVGEVLYRPRNWPILARAGERPHARGASAGCGIHQRPGQCERTQQRPQRRPVRA